MTKTVPKIEYPPKLVDHLKQFSAFFPEKVKWDPDTHTVESTEELSLELRISISYLRLVGDVQDVMDNIDLVLQDLISLSLHPPIVPSAGERRYFLLTKVFFYELLRIRDAMPRFLKRFEEDGLMSKEDRHATKKLLEQQFSEHYLIRNVYLHGHSLPKSDREEDLSLIAVLAKHGYEPMLMPLSGEAVKQYPELLKELAVQRHDALVGIATDMVGFCQSIVNCTAEWVNQHDFGRGPEVQVKKMCIPRKEDRST